MAVHVVCRPVSRARRVRNKKAVETTASALAKYQIETKNFEAGKEAIRVKRNLTLTRIVEIGGFLIAVYMAYLGYKEIEQKIDNFGTPVVVNSRGEISRLPVGDSLRFYRDGEFKDTYKDSIK